jgi:hypothetical protein
LPRWAASAPVVGQQAVVVTLATAAGFDGYVLKTNLLELRRWLERSR